jgi:hypothetical protein
MSDLPKQFPAPRRLHEPQPQEISGVERSSHSPCLVRREHPAIGRHTAAWCGTPRTFKTAPYAHARSVRHLRTRSPHSSSLVDKTLARAPAEHGFRRTSFWARSHPAHGGETPRPARTFSFRRSNRPIRETSHHWDHLPSVRDWTPLSRYHIRRYPGSGWPRAGSSRISLYSPRANPFSAHHQVVSCLADEPASKKRPA